MTSVSGTSAGLVADGGRLVVSRADGKLTVTAIDGKGQSIGPLKASLKRGKLEFGLEYAGSDQQEQLKTQLVKAFMGVLVKDFRATLSAGPAGTVYLSYSGKATNDLPQERDERRPAAPRLGAVPELTPRSSRRRHWLHHPPREYG